MAITLLSRELKPRDYVNFFRNLYGNSIEDLNSKAFLAKSSEEANIQKPCRSISSIVKKVNDMDLFSAGLFYKHNSSCRENLRFLTAIVLDFDFGKQGDNSWNSMGIYDHVESTTGFKPHYVWPTKTEGDYQAAILIEPLTGHIKSIRLYEMLSRSLAINTGADLCATTANHLFRIPRCDMLVSTHSPYNINQFKTWFNETQIEREKERVQKQNVIVLRDREIIKHPAIQCLLNAEFDSYRNHAAYTLALIFYALGYSEKEARDYLCGNWYLKACQISGANPFRKCEVEASVRSAFSGKYSPSKIWIESLTGIPFPYIITARKSERAIYKSQNEIRTAIINYLRSSGGTIKTKQQHFSEEIGISYRSLKRELTALRNEGIISYETNRGKGSETTYILTANVFLKDNNRLIGDVQLDYSIVL